MENKVNNSTPQLNLNKSNNTKLKRRRGYKKRRNAKRDQNLLCYVPTSKTDSTNSDLNQIQTKNNGFTNLIKHALKEIRDEKN